MSPTSTPRAGPSVQVDLPTAASQIGQLSPHDSSPNWVDQVTGIGTALLAIVAILALRFTYTQITQYRKDSKEQRANELSLREQARDARNAETFINISQRWHDEVFHEARRNIKKHLAVDGPEGLSTKLFALQSADDPQFLQMVVLLDFFEELAILVRYHAISFEMADNAFGSTACRYWEIFQPFVVSLRREPINSGSYEEFENFAKKISGLHNY